MADTVLLVGSGYMGIEYAKVLKHLNIPMTVVSRGLQSSEKFEQETGIRAIPGGIEKWLVNEKQYPDAAIVCVTENMLGDVTRRLIQAGIKSILVEKPGGLSSDDIRSVERYASNYKADVYVGYNRRFHTSTLKGKEIIQEDGGVTSFNFEFTEWSHVIEGLQKAEGVKEEWFLANSTHVIDLAFYLGGVPKEICTFTSGGTHWHPTASVYVGAGKSEKGALFSYQANWEAPGRWSTEILTRKHRLIFRPLEKLQIQKIGSIAIEEVSLDDKLDKEFKPGLYRMVDSFIAEDKQGLQPIGEQVRWLEFYEKINKKR